MSGQEDFDFLLAKAMQTIHNPDTSAGLVTSILKGDPVAGLAGATRAVVNKVVGSAKATGKPVKANMIPDLSLELTAQMAEMVTQKTGQEIGKEEVLQAFQSFIQDYTKDGLKGGHIKPDDIISSVEKIKAKTHTQGGNVPGASQTPQEPQQGMLQQGGRQVQQLDPIPQPRQPIQQINQAQQKFDPFNPQQTMTQKLDRGLL